MFCEALYPRHQDTYVAVAEARILKYVTTASQGIKVLNIVGHAIQSILERRL